MRCTQYVGLNNRGISIVEKMERVPNSTNYTLGMFEEKVSLGEWRDEKDIILEVVQAAPWSSGPVILTCLEKNGEKIPESLWIEDRSYMYEVDFRNGTYWI